jgi:hypothetical protein
LRKAPSSERGGGNDRCCLGREFGLRRLSPLCCRERVDSGGLIRWLFVSRQIVYLGANRWLTGRRPKNVLSRRWPLGGFGLRCSGCGGENGRPKERIAKAYRRIDVNGRKSSQREMEVRKKIFLSQVGAVPDMRARAEVLSTPSGHVLLPTLHHGALPCCVRAPVAPVTGCKKVGRAT